MFVLPILTHVDRHKVVNPRYHVVATDKVTQKFPAAAIAGLSDEKALALFTSGFFSGVIFGFERLILRTGGYNLLPARYTSESWMHACLSLPIAH